MECNICFEKKICVRKCKNCNLHICNICKNKWKLKNYGIYSCPYRCNIIKYKTVNSHYYFYLILLSSNIFIIIKSVLFLHYFLKYIY